MLRSITFLFAACFFCLSVWSAEFVEPVMVPGAMSEGNATVTPQTCVASEFGTWTVTYTVGQSGIATGGGIRVQMPDDWHAGPRNSAYSLQSKVPKADHFVRAVCSRSDVTIRGTVESQREPNVLIKHPKQSLNGRYERYVFVARALVEKGELREGDTISVIYGDRSGGSRGIQAGVVVTPPLPVLIAVDTNGDSRFNLLADSPTIQCLPGEPIELLFHAPSQAVAGETVRCLIAAVDKEYNPVHESLRLDLQCLKGKAQFPRNIEMPAGQGYVEFDVTPKKTGVLRLKAVARSNGLQAQSNPTEVLAKRGERSLYWGELHSHTRYSWDGVGRFPFEYARYTSGLDYYTMTDHSLLPVEQGSRGLSDKYWKEYTELIDKYYEPEKFVTLQAYECSFGTPYGHHNVFFRGAPGALIYPGDSTLQGLWAELKKGDALTIPHHTGKFPKNVDYTIHDPDLRRNFEIYSGHGLSEVYNPAHPLAFEYSQFTSDSKSLDWPSHAQDVWRMGLMLSTVASSDDHRAQPGKPSYGLTAIRAESLTRDGIFQGLYDRQTYGTTGAKIILEFSLNGTPMGQSLTVDGLPRLTVRVIGTDIIDTVEILRWQPSDKTFSVLKSWCPDVDEFEGHYTDEEYEQGSIYYARVMQKNKIRNRIVMAWSSPIWTQ